MSTHGLPSLAPSNITVPIITNSSATVPGSGIEPRDARQRLAQPQPALPHGQRRDPREEVEVDRERLAARIHVSVPKHAIASSVIAL